MKYTKLAELINQCDWENAEKEFQICQHDTWTDELAILAATTHFS